MSRQEAHLEVQRELGIRAGWNRQRAPLTHSLYTGHLADTVLDGHNNLNNMRGLPAGWLVSPRPESPVAY